MFVLDPEGRVVGYAVAQGKSLHDIIPTLTEIAKRYPTVKRVYSGE